jgi:FAD/FMN-containing dehydrogenase
MGAALRSPYDELYREIAGFIAPDRLITDPLRLLTWGTDASFYRLVPAIAVVVASEQEVVRLLAACARLATPVTFRAAGTSLSGQAITDSVLVLLEDSWRRCEVGNDGSAVTVQPGVIGAEVNRRLAPFGRKLGPDPASIDSAKVGGIAANNASGMCCGTAQNTYHTVLGMRVVLADGTVLDTRDAASRASFRERNGTLWRALDVLARDARGNEALAARIRRKFRMKNTTGYSLNALVDFEDPIDVLAHLMVGSEGTLGFISEITYETVPEYADKASALILFDELETACEAVSLLAATPVVAVELADRAALRSVESKPGLPESLRAVGPNGAALLVETRAADAATLTRQIGEIEAALAGVATFEPVRFSTDPAECARFWNVRKGMFPSVGAMRKVGTTVIIEDVAFPVARLAAATLDLQRLLAAHGYPDAIIFGHALAGNLHFVFTQDFNAPAEVERYRRFMDELCHMVVERYDGSLKAEHGTGRNIAPYVELEWGPEAYALMRRIKEMFDPRGLLNPGVLINDDPEAHVRNLKPLPQADPLVDACIECGFCEPKCPSRGLTLSPRQRIVGWREIARQERRRPGRRGNEVAVRLSRHRHLRRLRTVRHGVPGRHRNGALDQGAAGQAGIALRASRREHGCGSLRNRHDRRACGPGLRRRDARCRRDGRDARIARHVAPMVGRPAAEVVAGDAASCQGGPRAGAGGSACGSRGLLSELRGAHDGRAARRRRGSIAARGRAAVSQGRVRPDRSREPARAVLRPAVREQGLHGSRRSQVRRARGRAARGERGRTLAHRLRYESLRLSNETFQSRPDRGPGQHRVHPRRGAASGDDGALPRADHRPSGVQRAQDGHAREARRHRPSLQRRRRRGPRRALLRLCRRQGIQPARAQRVRAAASGGKPSAGLHTRLLDEPDVRDRPFEQAGFAYRSIIDLVDSCATVKGGTS